MRIKRTIFAGISVVVLAISAWVSIPPFPSPAALLGDSLSNLTAKLGPPTGYAPSQDPTSFHWVENRGPAEWSLIIAFYYRGPVGTSDRPISVVRCLYVGSTAVWPLCKFVTTGRLHVPNNRLD
jgi:hypothetical protein